MCRRAGTIKRTPLPSVLRSSLVLRGIARHNAHRGRASSSSGGRRGARGLVAATSRDRRRGQPGELPRLRRGAPRTARPQWKRSLALLGEMEHGISRQRGLTAAIQSQARATTGARRWGCCGTRLRPRWRSRTRSTTTAVGACAAAGRWEEAALLRAGGRGGRRGAAARTPAPVRRRRRARSRWGLRRAGHPAAASSCWMMVASRRPTWWRTTRRSRRWSTRSRRAS